MPALDVVTFTVNDGTGADTSALLAVGVGTVPNMFGLGSPVLSGGLNCVIDASL